MVVVVVVLFTLDYVVSILYIWYKICTKQSLGMIARSPTVFTEMGDILYLPEGSTVAPRGNTSLASPVTVDTHLDKSSGQEIALAWA